MPVAKRRIQVFIGDIASRALDVIVAETGETQTAIIERLLIDACPTAFHADVSFERDPRNVIRERGPVEKDELHAAAKAERESWRSGPIPKPKDKKK